MSNIVVNTEIPVGARLRTGVPNEVPEAVISKLKKHFSSRPMVDSARLGLMQVITDENPEGFFTYTIGIICKNEQQLNSEIDAASNAITHLPISRWPVSFFPAVGEYFTHESIVFYQAESSSSKPNQGFFAKLFGSDK